MIKRIIDFLRENYRLGVVVFLVLFIVFISLLSFFGFSLGVILLLVILLINLVWIVWAGTRIFEDIKSGKIFRGIEDIAIIGLVLGILIVLYIISSNRSLKFDLTSEQLYSLSPYSMEVIKSLNSNVKITLFARRGEATELEKILEEYSKNSEKISFISVDPIKDPITAKRYELPQGESIIIVVESGANKKYIRGTSLIEYQQTSYGPRAVGIKVEEEVTSAILDVIGSSRTIYFLVGNGEHRILNDAPGGDSEYTFKTWRSYLEKANFTLKELNLSTTKDIPSDAGSIVILGPRRIIPIEVQDKLYAYFTNGGSIVILLEPIIGSEVYDKTFSINYLLTKLGFYVKNNVVFDQERFNPYVGRLFYIIPYIHYSPITSDIRRKGLPIQLVTAMAIGRLENIEGQLGYRYYDIMSSSEDSWGEVSIPESGKNFTASSDEKDIKPPIILGYAIEKVVENDKSKTSKMVIIGDIDFLSDYFIESMSGNLELALNIIEWSSREGGMLGIKPKSIKQEPVVIPSSADANLVLVLSLIVVPLLVVVPGILVWFIRSRNVN
ncbi:MAG: GldG family protein [Brevinematales bacterium]|nr:GldG family protein [Brevinematales bacterium]